MISMKNKKSLLLPLFLLLPAATQCMEQDNSKLIAHNKSHAKQSRKTKQKTIHQLQHERDRLKKKLQEHWDDGVAQKNMSFKEKKKLIQHFFKRGCKRPTHKDKKLAFVEKWERCTPSIIKEIYHW